MGGQDGQNIVGTPGDDRGLKTERRVYRPYGTSYPTFTLAGNVDGPVSKGWIGERFDADASLQYLNARTYDPDVLMFLEPDWWEVTEPGVGTNCHANAGGDPANWGGSGANLGPPQVRA